MQDEAFSILNKLARHNKLTPDAVLDAARDPNSTLHSRFNWDDQEAAESYRRGQARDLIQSFTVEVEVRKRSTREVSVSVPAFVNLNRNGGAVEPYQRRADVLAQPDARARLVREILTSIDAQLARAADLSELDAVRTAVSSALTRVAAAA
jgi:hypothetical protein